jgi:alpha-L-fucosidase
MNPFLGRPLPGWWSHAGLGILVHWGPYSVPAWAPVGPDPVIVAEERGWGEALRLAPYAEWYWNGLALEGSAVAAYHEANHAGAAYDDFAAGFADAAANVDADAWADLFVQAGAGYVVLTAKHHDGFLLWDSPTVNPHRGAAWQVDIDVVGEVAAAVRRRGLRFGTYYSGGFDWTFQGLGAGSAEALQAAMPSDPAHAAYVSAHWLELIDRYRPDVLWNDVQLPGGAEACHDLFTHYYEVAPEGVVNDRFDLAGAATQTTHADIVTPQHRDLTGIPRRAFEVCRPLGTSFGWNRAEADTDLISTEQLVDVLVDVRSRGGNLLLGIGPTAHGSIPRIQRQRLEGLATWMEEAAEAVVGTRPWDLPALPTADGRLARATTANGSLYLTVCGAGGGSRIAITGLALPAEHEVRLLGHGDPIPHSSARGALVVELPASAPRPPVLRITPAPRLEVH